MITSKTRKAQRLAQMQKSPGLDVGKTGKVTKPAVIRTPTLGSPGTDRLNIKSAIKKPGQLHRDLGVPQGEKIPQAKLDAAAKQGGKVGERARFAEKLEGFKK